MAKKVFIAEFDADGKAYFRTLDEMERRTVASSKRLSDAISSVGRTFAGIAASGAVLSFMDKSIDAFIQEEKILRKLEVSVGRTSRSLKEYASYLQTVTTYADDEILSAMSRIALFVKEEKTIKALTKATIDFAYAKDMDLTVAAELVAKTLAGSGDALSRYGIELGGVETVQDKVNALLRQFNDIAGGQSAAALDTYGGKLQNLRNQLDDIQEEIGSKLLPIWVKLNEALLFYLNNFKLIGAGIISPVLYNQELLKMQAEQQQKNNQEVITPSPYQGGIMDPKLEKFQNKIKKTGSKKKDRKLPDELGNVYMQWYDQASLEEFKNKILSQQPSFLASEFASQMSEGMWKGTGIDDLLKQWAEEAAREFNTKFSEVLNVARSVQSIFNITADSFAGKLISAVETVAQILSIVESLKIIFGVGLAKGGTVINKNGAVSITGIPQFAGGGSFMVPPGYSGDNYPILVKSGERVDVTPINQVPNITQLLKQINNSIQASTMTAIKSKNNNPIVVNLQVDGRTLAKQVISTNNNFSKSGLNFDEL